MKYQLVARPRKRTADSFGPARTHSVPGEGRRAEVRGGKGKVGGRLLTFMGFQRGCHWNATVGEVIGVKKKTDMLEGTV